MRLILAMLLACVASACTSNTYLVHEREPSPYRDKGRVFVTNPDMSKEYKILSDSNIYTLVGSSDSKTKLTLHPLEKRLSCGNPMLGSALSLGLIPVSVSDKYVFQYEISSGEQKYLYTYDVPVTTRYSLWEWIFKPFAKGEEGLIEAGLPISTLEIHEL